MSKARFRIMPAYGGYFKVQKRVRPFWMLFAVHWIDEGDWFNSEAEAQEWIDKYGDLG